MSLIDTLTTFRFLLLACLAGGCSDSGETRSSSPAPQPEESLQKVSAPQIQIQYGDLEKRFDELQTTLDTARNKVQGLEAELAREQDRAERAETGILMLENRIQTLAQKLDALKLQNALLGAENARLNAGLSEFQTSLADAPQAQAILVENAQLKAENQALKRQLESTSRKQPSVSGVNENATALEIAKKQATAINKAYQALLLAKASTSAQRKGKHKAAAILRKNLEAAQAEVARLSGAKGIYTVQSGDTLSSIATHIYKDSRRWSDIHRANTHLLNHPNHIHSGMVLVIPY